MSQGWAIRRALRNRSELQGNTCRIASPFLGVRNVRIRDPQRTGKPLLNVKVKYGQMLTFDTQAGQTYVVERLDVPLRRIPIQKA